MISLLTFIPLIAAGWLLFIPKGYERMARWLALGATLIPLLICLNLIKHFDFSAGGLQFVEKHSWIPNIGAEYFVGVDGFNILMVLLISILAPLTILASWNIQERQRTWFALILVEIFGLYGAFTALNFVHWFIYWELVLVPIFFLIKLFGNEDKNRAALSFFIFTVLGSAFMLVAFLLLRVKTGTFDFMILNGLATSGKLPAILGDWYPVVFFCILLGLWVKVPLFPLHVWQAPAYTQAPSAVTMLLTGVLSKMGVYGFLRLVLPVFPEALNTYAYPLLAVALLTLLIGAFAALQQKDIKTLFAYTSLNHVAYCLFGFFAVGLSASGIAIPARELVIQGCILQMFAHGLGAAGLFYMAGILEERSGSRRIADFGGLGTTLPHFTAIFCILIFSSLGLPFLAGFSAEFLIFSGVFAVAPVFAGIATLGLLATAYFLLSLIRKLFTGAEKSPLPILSDMSQREWLIAIPLILMAFWIGCIPSQWLEFSRQTVQQTLTLFP